MIQLGNIKVRCFVLTVQEFPHKTSEIQKHLLSVGIEAEEFPCLCAYEPLAADQKAVTVSGLETSHTYEVDNPGSGYRIGTKGTVLNVSFQMFWTAAMFMPEEHFLFIEWDARFEPNWKERAEQAVLDTPADFDFLFLGSCCCKDKPKTHVKGEIFQVKWPMCNHAQIIARKAMPTLLRTQRRIYAPADISLAFHAFPHLRVYTLLPRCVHQTDTLIPP